jgi:WD40 repeat protein
LAAADYRGTIRLFDAESGAFRRALHAHKAMVLELAITNDGQTLVSRSADGTVKIWNLSENDCPSLLRGHSSPIHSVAFAQSGELVSVDLAGKLKRWELKTGTEVSSRKLKIDNAPTESWIHAELSSDGESVVVCTRDQVGHILDSATGRERFRCVAPIGWSKHREFSSDGRLFAAFEGKHVHVFEADSGRVRTTIPTPPGSFDCLTFLPNGKQLATVDAQRICIWNIADGKQQSSIWNLQWVGLPFLSQTLVCSPDGRMLAGGAMVPGGPNVRTLQLWDVRHKVMIASKNASQTGIFNLIFSPDSKTLVLSVSESPPHLKLWNVAVQEEVGTLRSASPGERFGLPGAPTIAFSRDGRVLAQGNADGTIDLFWGQYDQKQPDVSTP